MVSKIGHRGAAGHAPENTLQSFDKAVLLGCDITELDVHLCSSNEVVVIHDETVDRTTNGTGFVSNLSLKNIKEFDPDKPQKGDKPTLIRNLEDSYFDYFQCMFPYGNDYEASQEFAEFS